MNHCNLIKKDPFEVIPMTVILKLDKKTIDRNLEGFKEFFHQTEKYIEGKTSDLYRKFFSLVISV